MCIVLSLLYLFIVVAMLIIAIYLNKNTVNYLDFFVGSFAIYQILVQKTQTAVLNSTYGKQSK